MARPEFPEEGELVMCTVTKVYPTSVFVTLDEWGDRSGMIHISEIAPGRIRNIRDYVVEGKKIVCKVLRIDKKKGHIDLSFRRVSDAQRREKVDEIKQAQRATQIITYVAEQCKENPMDIAKKIADYALKEYDTIFNYFEDIALDHELIKEAKLPKKVEETLLEVITTRIKPPQVSISAEVSIKSYAPNGIEVIKKALQDTLKVSDQISITYLGGGRYALKVVDEDYKSAEKVLKKASDVLTSAIRGPEGEIAITRT
ncbi:translation initiation factor IF-2 subunit alpha [Candidatus Woesearchaeota archaeon]|nr:MAG: translation initiation factor IF-2 subunit alpha [Candidatus Woesearchaeota archaeon]